MHRLIVLRAPTGCRRERRSPNWPTTRRTAGSGGFLCGGSRPKKSAIRSWPSAVSSNSRSGGPSIYPPIPREVMAGQSVPGRVGDVTAREAARRSVYVHVKRSLLVPILATHDAADTDSSCPVRYTTTVPTQALGMLNGEFANEQAAPLRGPPAYARHRRSGRAGPPGDPADRWPATPDRKTCRADLEFVGP